MTLRCEHANNIRFLILCAGYECNKPNVTEDEPLQITSIEVCCLDCAEEMGWRKTRNTLFSFRGETVWLCPDCAAKSIPKLCDLTFTEGK